jgi:hypothetical protein
VKVGYIKSERGQYCNNGDGCWVKDIKYCPARWALTSGHDIVLPKPKRKYTKKVTVVEKPKRKYVKKVVKKKPVVKKAIPKRKKKIIYG